MMGGRTILFYASTAAAVVASNPAQAQTSPPDATETAREDQGIADIVVTAQRRAESIQDVPVSVTAFTGDQLRAQGIDDLGDLSSRAPNLYFSDYTDLKIAPTSIRGVYSTTTSAGQDPAVGTYLNEVFLGTGVAAAIDYFDVERIEVLRGPQGTLFGRNTVGGVIAITTRRPTPEFEGYVDTAYGNYDYSNTTLAAGGPVSGDRLMARIAVNYLRRDGWGRNLFRGGRVNDANRLSARGSLLFKPWEGGEFLLTADYRFADQSTRHHEILAYNPNGLLTRTLIARGLPLDTDPFDQDIYADLKARETLSAYGFGLNGSIELGELTLNTVTSYRDVSYDNITDTESSQLSWLYDGVPEESWRFLQEVRLTSPSNRPFEWLVGAFYFHQYTDNTNFVTLGSDLARAIRVPQFAGFVSGSFAQQKVDSYAAFANVTVRPVDKLEISAGARYSRDEKLLHYRQVDPFRILGGTVAPLVASDAWGAFTPSASVRYHFTPDVMAYATVSRGFKSGGYNDALGSSSGISFGPEYIWNYEAGLKSTWLDRRLVLNLAAFYMDWTDIQLTVDDPNTPVFDPRTANAGAAHSKGIEIEATAIPVEGLRLSGNLALTEAEYDEGSIPTGAGLPEIPLRRIPFSPKYSYALQASYTAPLGGDLKLTASVDYLRRGSIFLTPDNQPRGFQRAYGLLNGQLTLASGQAWSLGLWGKNLTDTKYKRRLFDLYNTAVVGTAEVQIGDPRAYGVQARFNF